MNATAAAMAKIADATIISIRLKPRASFGSDFKWPCTLSSVPPPYDRRLLHSPLESDRRQGHALRAPQLVPGHRHRHLDADGVAEIRPADRVQLRRRHAVVQLPLDLRPPRCDRVGG